MNYKRKQSKQRLTAKIKNIIEENTEHLILNPNILMEIINLLKDCQVRYRSQDLRSRKWFREKCFWVIERLYWSQFEDSQYVGIFLNCLFEVDPFLYSAIIPLSGICPSFNDVKDNKLFQFFAQHAYQEKLLFNGRRLPYHAIELAILRYEPSLLREMLRFGALLDGKTHNVQVVRGSNCIEGRLYPKSNVILNTLKRILSLNPAILKMENVVFDSIEKRKIYENLIVCCKYLLTDSSQWNPFEIIKLGDWDGFGFQQIGTKRNAKDVAEEFSANVLPGFKTHFTQPMSLKEVCRLSIRQALNNNWSLPRGINEFHIPESLKMYLDI